LASESKVFKRLQGHIEAVRHARGHRRDHEVATNLGLTPQAFSKWASRPNAVPEDGFVARVVQYAGLTDDEFGELLLDAATERAARAAKSPFAQMVAERWKRSARVIHNLETPDRYRADPEGLLIDALRSTGVNVDSSEVRSAVRRLAGAGEIDKVALSAVGELFEATRRYPQSSSILPEFGELTNQIRLQSRVLRRKLTPGADGLLPVPTSAGFVDWILPVLPGLLIHVISLDKGQKVPRHADHGTEAVFVLEGEVEFRFEGRNPFRLVADDREMILYDSSIEHECVALTKAVGVTVHHDPLLVEKWDSYLMDHRRRMRAERDRTLARSQENLTAAAPAKGDSR
jgi:quercetin dioxygenase-like cupin family protein